MMFRSAFKVYKKNIWDVFAVTGFIVVGILVGLLITIPTIGNEINVSVNKIVAQATSVSYSGFDPATFLKSLIDQVKNLDTKNLVRTVNMLIDQNGIYRIFMGAIQDANFNEDVLIEMKDVVAQCSDNLINVLKEQLIKLAVCIAISFIVALFLSRFIIQIRSTPNKHFGKFLASFLLNSITVLFAYSLIAVCVLSFDGVFLIVCVVSILLGTLTLDLLWSVICYKPKGTDVSELFTFKNVILLWLAALIVIAMSAMIAWGVYSINELAVLIILLPLVIISNIICENIACDYVNRSQKNKEQKVAVPEKVANGSSGERRK